MNKRTLLDFINNEASHDEQERVLEWLERSEENRAYYNSLKNLCAVEGMPEKRADESEFREFKAKYGIRTPKPKRRRGWLAVSITAVATACIAAPITLRISDRVINIEQQEPILAYKTDRGVKGKVLLPDGSVVTLNSDSRISFPARFEGSFREVTFEGEGYFEVVGNEDFPMKVRTADDIEIEVKGTEFNLCSYPNDHTVKATLYSGAITIFSNDVSGRRSRTDVCPLETVTIQRKAAVIRNTDQRLVVEAKPDPQKDTAWKRGELIFDDEPMEEVIKKIERWHGVDFTITDQQLLSRNFSARFKCESIQQIMEMMRIAANIEYDIDGNMVILVMR